MTDPSEPILDIAQLAHVELLTPDVEGSCAFFAGLLGMQETERAGGSIYLRGYEEHYHHSLKLTGAPAPGLGHVAWRCRTPRALDRRVAAIETAGLGRGWISGDAGHGRAFRFETPEGHPMEIFWDVVYAGAPAGRETPLRNRPQRRPGQGVPVRRIDHLNLTTVDTRACRDFMTDVLGFFERERIDGGDTVVASFLSVTNLSHDIGLLPEHAAARGRFHHLCYYTTSVQHLFDLADLAREAGVVVEHGPGRHGVGAGTFLYLREPGGNRVEVIGDPGCMIFDPSWRTVVWQASELDVAGVWTGTALPDSFFIYATPTGEEASGEATAA
jgi:catechol 2,3-dioxygenase